MTDSIDYEAMRALAVRQRDALERIANIRVAPPPDDLPTDRATCYRMGVKAAKDAILEAKREAE